ncbi:hypothetical protein [Mycobacteroides chelonae]|uniref:hypothetical protein n=1 Tax=Mycobacteroides chelonae TaxID=1774 RepID=UPI0009924765|nr:hypothetical protein [Mycobacteroides chelonae]
MSNPLVRVERVPADDARFAWAKNVEFTIFGLENDFAGDVDIAAGEMVHYRPWERSSEIYVGFTEESREHPVGVLRSLRYDPELGFGSFSTLRDARSFRGHGGPAGMIEQIWQAFFGALAADGVQFVTVALVVPLFDWYQHLLPHRLHQIGDILPDYIGADSVPAVLDISGSFVPDATDAVRDGSLLTATTALPSPDKERTR